MQAPTMFNHIDEFLQISGKYDLSKKFIQALAAKAAIFPFILATPEFQEFQLI